MIKIGFEPHYRVLHLTNELLFNSGGVHSHITEQYRHRDTSTGFVEYRDNLDFDIAEYDGRKDILIVTSDDIGKIETLGFDIIAIHFYRLWAFITPRLLERHKLVYVVHSVPTPEPPPRPNPFGGHEDVEQMFKSLCHHAAAIVCVSRAEVAKLTRIYPEYAPKTICIYNGITFA